MDWVKFVKIAAALEIIGNQLDISVSNIVDVLYDAKLINKDEAYQINGYYQTYKQK